MSGPAVVQRGHGESYDQLAGPTYPQHPIIDGPFFLNALPTTTDFGLRFVIFFNPWGGVEPARFPNVTTWNDWAQVYPEPTSSIDWSQTGGFSVYAQNYHEVGVPFNNGYDQWMHKGNAVPDGSDGQSRISCGYLTVSVGGVPDGGAGATRKGGYDRNAIYWSFIPDPPAPGIFRDGYYRGSHKHNGLSGTMPGIYVQSPGDCNILVMAHLDLRNNGQIQTIQHGGPQDVGWTYHGINRPHRFSYSEPLREWGVVMSLWSKTFNNFIGYTGDIPWRLSSRDSNYQMQSLIFSVRGKPTGTFGGTT